MRQQDIAYLLAGKAHAGQFRRDGFTPYFNHVQDVARIVQMRGGNDEAIAAAYCHDVLEDTDISERDMEEAGLCREVIEAAQYLTFTFFNGLTYEQNVKNLLKNKIARQVKIADNLSNLSDDPTDKQILKYAKSLQILMEN